jgi:hypothetical protein
MAGEVIATGEPAQPKADWLGWLDSPITFLRQPWLILASSLLLLLLLLANVFLPQMPGQVAEDPVAATRWLNETAAGYNSGALLRSLSLFSVLNSTLFRLNAALLAILAAVHLADAFALALAFVRLPRILDAPAAQPGDPLTIRFPHPIYRHRYAAPSPPEALSQELISQFAQDGDLQERTVALPFTGPAPASEPEADAATHGDQTERRWLALRQMRAAWLRPWLFAGLLLGLATLWGTVQFGWSISPPALAPGESYINSLHDVALVHRVQQTGAQNPVQSVLSATVTSESISLPVGQETGGQAGGAQVLVEQGPPALWMAAPDALFSLPGGAVSDRFTTLGLAFPRLGSEQFVVLPAQNAGLRIVLLGNQGDRPTPSFLIEVYEGQSVQPAQRLQIDHDQELTVEVDGEDVNLRVAPTYSLLATVERRPGSWLLWLALVLALVGTLGFLRRPGFILAQVAPWPDQRSVVVLQSSEKLTGDR